MHGRQPHSRREQTCAGVTFLELIVALFIISLTLLAIVSAYDYYLKEAGRIQARVTVAEVENPVRQAVFDTVRGWLRNARPPTSPLVCRYDNPSLVGLLNQTLPSGIQLRVLDATTAAGMRELDETYPGARLFNQGLARCANSPLAPTPPATPNPISAVGSAAIYFCLRIEAAPGSGAGGAGSFLSMQPAFAEFTYYTMHTSAYPHPGGGVAFGPVTCGQIGNCFAPPAPVAHGLLGSLFYAIHWSPKILKGRTKMRIYSILSRGG